jgi:guanylate kinase
VDGVAYHFLSPEEFARREAAGGFVETATYGGYRYGTLRDEVERVLASGRHGVLDIEVAGARQVRRAFPDAVLVFILPPSASALVDRLRERKTEDVEEQLRRLDHAAQELTAAAEYDYVVVNDDLVSAVDRVAAILDGESRRTARLDNLEGVVARLRRELETFRTQLVTS